MRWFAGYFRIESGMIITKNTILDYDFNVGFEPRKFHFLVLL
jgi:hypothetical protein